MGRLVRLHGPPQRHLAACRGATTTNSLLANRLSAYVEDGAAIVPNVMNRTQQAYSRELLDAKVASGFRRDGPVTIGYFSGTPSHVRDFAIASPSMARLLDEDEDVSVRIVGYLDDLGALEPHRERVEFQKFMHYVELQRSIAEVEVNIAPLSHTAFNICKSDLKFFEAAAVGTWTVASHTPSLDDGHRRRRHGAARQGPRVGRRRCARPSSSPATRRRTPPA